MADAGDAEETEERRDKARKVVGEVGRVDEVVGWAVDCKFQLTALGFWSQPARWQSH